MRSGGVRLGLKGWQGTRPSAMLAESTPTPGELGSEIGHSSDPYARMRTCQPLSGTSAREKRPTAVGTVPGPRYIRIS